MARQQAALRPAAPVRWVAVVLLGAAGPALRVLTGGGRIAVAGALVLVTGAVSLLLAPPGPAPSWRPRLAAAVAVAVLAAWSWIGGFALPAGVAAVNTVLAHGALVAWRVPWRPVPPASVGGLALGPLLASNVLWARTGSLASAAAMAALSLLVLEVGAQRPHVVAAVDRALLSAAGAVAGALAALLSWSAWAVAVLPIWVLSRSARYDPLDAGWARAGTGWVAPNVGTGDPGAARRLAGCELDRAPTVRRRARLRWAPVLVGLLALGAVLLPAVADRLPDGGGRALATDLDLRPTRTGMEESALRIPDDQLQWAGVPVTDYAHEEEPFARALFRELLAANPNPDLLLGLRNRDVSGRYVNVVDGRRRSYTPERPQLTVWFLGGSTMYGIGQRDDHTIPSEVARLAEQDGIRIRPVNLAASGDVNWVATIRFAEALHSDVPPPDLVVFYDGWNDYSLGFLRASEGDVEPGHLTRWPYSERERQLERSAHGRRDRPAGHDERRRLGIELSAAQYRSGVEVARRLAAERGVPVVHFWQPFAALKPPSAADAELHRIIGFDPAWRDGVVADYREIRERSGVGPVDVSTVFDGVDRPVYFDQGHTNELGARIVAAELYRHLGPRLGQLLAER